MCTIRSTELDALATDGHHPAPGELTMMKMSTMWLFGPDWHPMTGRPDGEGSGHHDRTTFLERVFLSNKTKESVTMPLLGEGVEIHSFLVTFFLHSNLHSIQIVTERSLAIRKFKKWPSCNLKISHHGGVLPRGQRKKKSSPTLAAVDHRE